MSYQEACLALIYPRLLGKVGILPVFEGYTVDVRLHQFRRILKDQCPEFIEFSSPEGEALLQRLCKKIETDLDTVFSPMYDPSPGKAG